MHPKNQQVVLVFGGYGAAGEGSETFDYFNDVSHTSLRRMVALPDDVLGEACPDVCDTTTQSCTSAVSFPWLMMYPAFTTAGAGY
jgi:hypothetical protein